MGIFVPIFPCNSKIYLVTPLFYDEFQIRISFNTLRYFLKKSLSACFLDDIRNSLAKIVIFWGFKLILTHFDKLGDQFLQN